MRREINYVKRVKKMAKLFGYFNNLITPPQPGTDDQSSLFIIARARAKTQGFSCNEAREACLLIPLWR